MLIQEILNTGKENSENHLEHLIVQWLKHSCLILILIKVPELSVSLCDKTFVPPSPLPSGVQRSPAAGEIQYPLVLMELHRSHRPVKISSPEPQRHEGTPVSQWEGRDPTAGSTRAVVPSQPHCRHGAAASLPPRVPRSGCSKHLLCLQSNFIPVSAPVTALLTLPWNKNACISHICELISLFALMGI